MVTPKNLIQNAKTDLGWDTRDADYIFLKLHWDEKYYEKLTSYRFRTPQKGSGSTTIGLPQKALRDYEKFEDEVFDGGEATGTAVAFWVDEFEIEGYRDINGWIWDMRNRRNIGVIENKTLDGIWNMVKADVPMDRNVRQILGALEDPIAPVLTFPADYTSLNSDAQVRAFLQITQAKPVCIFVLLHSMPLRANTLPPTRAKPYFDLDRFDLPNEYDDFAEDSDANSSPPPLSTGRGQPRTHHTESSAGDMPSDTFCLNSEGYT
ncbi:hypothetical protein BGX38DRAFT_1281520 [Terfezia claveryi]|nr:hypothetical protein BGX38DRAFT_1281520 [Terfezia claveryi]